jgi:hypothetical protein
MAITQKTQRTTALIGGVVAVASAAAAAAYYWGVRPWYQQWGATKTETEMPLPGDELVSKPAIVRTKAVTIQAPVEAVWPWLIQMGQDKAGLYSYELIENQLLNCDIHNSDHIVPEWQHLQVGDQVRLYPKDRQGPPPYTVAAIEPHHALVMGHREENGEWFDSWQFVLLPTEGGGTRLIHRVRSKSMGVWDVMQFGYFVMERAMVLGIKQRAEKPLLSLN